MSRAGSLQYSGKITLQAMRTFLCALLALPFCALGAAADAVKNTPSAGSKEVRIAGSDILGPVLEAKIAELAKPNKIGFKCDFSGSVSAQKAVADGSADIAIAAVPLGMETKAPKDALMLPLAFHASLVAVNEANPVNEISIPQLRGLYSENAVERLESWSQLGVKGMNPEKVVAVSTGFSDGLVVELFKYGALGGSSFGSWVDVMDKKRDIFETLRNNNSAMAVVGKLRGERGIKVLAVSVPKNGKNYAFFPDADSFINSDYPLVLPFYVFLKRGAAANVREMARLLLGDETAAFLDASDLYYSVPKKTREAAVFELDTAR